MPQLDVRAKLLALLAELCAEKGRTAPLQDSDTLMGNLKLDSLDLAVLVVRLEQQFGFDPFRTGRPLTTTVGQLIATYEKGPT